MTDNIEKIKDDNIADKYLAFSRAIRKNERQKTAKAIFDDVDNAIKQRIKVCRLGRKSDKKVAPDDLEYWDAKIIGLTEEALPIIKKEKKKWGVIE